MQTLCLTLLLLVPFVNAREAEEETHDVWRDPNDPTREHRSQTTNALHSTLPAIPKPDQSLRLILRQLLHDLQVDYQLEGPIQKDVQVKISRFSMSVLSKYLTEESGDVPEDREAVRSALSNIFTVLAATPDPTWHDTFLTIQPFISTLNLIILPAAAVVVIRSVVKPRNFWILVFSTILLISMYTGYNRKYQEAESRRFAQFQESSRDACAPEGLLSRMVEIVASPFQYRQKSNCLKYIESQTISIFHEISIIEVFSETISSGFFAFMSASAKHLNLFFRNLYDGAPLIAQIVMTFFLILMVGTVRTPFFSYEPIWLTFCSTSIGKIAGWLEGSETEDSRPPAIQMHLTKKEVKRLAQAKKYDIVGTESSENKHENHYRSEKEKAIEYPKSEKEDGCGIDGETQKSDAAPEAVDDDLSILGESSEDEEDAKDTETEQNAPIDSSSLSDTSF